MRIGTRLLSVEQSEAEHQMTDFNSSIRLQCAALSLCEQVAARPGPNVEMRAVSRRCWVSGAPSSSQLLENVRRLEHKNIECYSELLDGKHTKENLVNLQAAFALFFLIFRFAAIRSICRFVRGILIRMKQHTSTTKSLCKDKGKDKE